MYRGLLIVQQYDCDQTITQELYFSCSGELPGQTHRGNPCYSLQDFPTELTPQVIPCCIVRILEECSKIYYQTFPPASLDIHVILARGSETHRPRRL